MKTHIFFVTVALTLPAIPAGAEVTNITGTIPGVVADIGFQGFISQGLPGAHFNLATLDLLENVNDIGGPSGGAPGIAWWDLVVTVTRAPGQTDGAMIAIDKDVTNFEPWHWTDFHMTLGRGTGATFVESSENDELFFKTNPAPLNELPFLGPNPVIAFPDVSFDEPVDPDTIWFTGAPGVAPGQTTGFWLGINIPESFFTPIPPIPGGGSSATFTLRQHATIPAPSAILMLGLAGLAAARRRVR